MISIASNMYKDDIAQNLDVHIKAVITASGGSPLTRTITNDNIIDRAFSFTDSVSQEDMLEIGSCIINQLVMTIDNPSTYLNFQYAGAKVVLSIGRKIAGEIQYLQKGIYYIVSDGYVGDVVTLTCYDTMVLLDKPFDASLFYDENGNFNTCNLQTLYNSFLNQSGVTCSYTLVNSMFPLLDVKGLEMMTRRQVLYYICQIEGKYARFNRYGHLELKHNKLGVSRGDTDIDETVYVIDNYKEGNAVLVSATKVSNISDGDDYNTGGETVYTLVVDGNPLIRHSTASTVTDTIETYYKNKYLQPLSCRIAPNELLEAGDKVKVVGSKGTEYARVTCITNLTYTLGEPEEISMGAETLEQNKTNRGVSQIEFELKNIKKKTQGINMIVKTYDADDRIVSLEYHLDDGSEVTTDIEYDSNGDITKIGGVTIS